MRYYQMEQIALPLFEKPNIMVKQIRNRGPANSGGGTTMMTNNDVQNFQGRKKDQGIGISGKVPVPKNGGNHS